MLAQKQSEVRSPVQLYVVRLKPVYINYIDRQSHGVTGVIRLLKTNAHSDNHPEKVWAIMTVTLGLVTAKTSAANCARRRISIM
jgi:hypothetical protein